MLYNVATLGTVLLSLIANSYVDQTYGWRTMFIITTLFTCIELLLIIFFVPEHTFQRGDPKESSSSGNTAIVFNGNINCEGINIDGIARSKDKRASHFKRLQPCTQRQYLCHLRRRGFRSLNHTAGG